MKTYHERETQKRFALYKNGKLFAETSDYNHHKYLLELYASEKLTVIVFNANQETPATVESQQ